MGWERRSFQAQHRARVAELCLAFAVVVCPLLLGGAPVWVSFFAFLLVLAAALAMLPTTFKNKREPTPIAVVFFTFIGLTVALRLIPGLGASLGRQPVHRCDDPRRGSFFPYRALRCPRAGTRGASRAAAPAPGSSANGTAVEVVGAAAGVGEDGVEVEVPRRARRGRNRGGPIARLLPQRPRPAWSVGWLRRHNRRVSGANPL